MMERECAFCRIIHGEASAFSVFRDDFSLAFLDRRPLFPGHCLLVPREHFETLKELPGDLTGRLFGNVQLLTRAVEEAMDAEGSFIALNNRVSQSVPHLHVHIVPRNRGDGLKGFFWPRHPYTGGEEMLGIQERIRRAVKRNREI